MPDPQSSILDPRSAIPWSRRDWFVSLLLFAIVFGLYFQTRRFDFVDYDDQVYIYQNPHIINGFTAEDLRWVVTETISSNWHPLTMLTELSVASMFGIHAGPFHLLNSFLHAINIALLFTFLKKATTQFWPAVFAAALWGFHPLRVESVAWVSELKDGLCGTMWLLCLLAYIRYVRRRTTWRYLLVVLLHLLALLAKPMAVTLPATLLLLDMWPLWNPGLSNRSRLKWWTLRVIEKLPLVLLSIAVTAYAIVTQRDTGATQSLSRFPLSDRLENSVISVADYLRDTVYPSKLGLFYPYPSSLVGGHIPIASVIFSLLLIVLISLGVLLGMRSKPYLLVGWLWFLGTLLPVIGLLQVGEQSHADRYTYVPSIGITVAVIFWVADLSATRPVMRKVAAAIGVTVAIATACSTFVYVGFWSDSKTLFTHSDRVIPNNYVAKAVLANQMRINGDIAGALRLSEQATTLSPNSLSPRFTRGLVLLDAGRFDEAADALSMSPMLDKSWYALGLVRCAQAHQCVVDHKPGEAAFRNSACDCFRNALKIDRNYADAEDALADQTARAGSGEDDPARMKRLRFAIGIWQDTLKRSPKFGPAHGHLADALRVTGDVAGAVRQYQLAIANGERYPLWESTLAYLVATAPKATPVDVQPLIAVATDARDQTQGKDPAALDALAACLARVGRFDDAIAYGRAAAEQARLQKNTAMAEDIEKRVTLYSGGQPYVAKRGEGN